MLFQEGVGLVPSSIKEVSAPFCKNVHHSFGIGVGFADDAGKGCRGLEDLPVDGQGFDGVEALTASDLGNKLLSAHHRDVVCDGAKVGSRGGCELPGCGGRDGEVGFP